MAGSAPERAAADASAAVDPSPEPAGAALPPQPTPAYVEGRKRCLACGAINPYEAKHCGRCGKTWTLAAATPAKQRTAYRQGGKLLVPRDASLPLFCIKCGQPANGEPVVQTFRPDRDSQGSDGVHWSHWIDWIFLFLPAAALAIVAAAAIVIAGIGKASGDPFFVSVPLCREHRQRYEGYQAAAWMLTLGAIPAAILVGFLAGEEGPGAALMTVVALAAAAAIAWRLARLLHAKGVDSSFAILTGACEEFLSRLRSESGSLARM